MTSPNKDFIQIRKYPNVNNPALEGEACNPVPTGTCKLNRGYMEQKGYALYALEGKRLTQAAKRESFKVLTRLNFNYI